MKPREIGQLIRVRPTRYGQRLAHCHDIADLRAQARRVIPRPVFDYVDGGADEELSMRANRAAFTRWRFVPRALTGGGAPDTTASVFGQVLPLPLVLCPTGGTRMVHPAGEIAAARAAGRAGLPYTLSTMATTSIEDLAAAAPGTGRWFQLYLLTDSGQNADLVERAAASGYQVLVVTIDTTVSGHRTRDLRHGLVIPPELTLASLASIVAKPGYWGRMLRAPAIAFANFPEYRGVTIGRTISKFNPAITWDDIAALRERWTGKLVIKGPLGAADAKRAVQAGADGLQLSNHGGRQLDRAVPPAELIAEVRAAVGPDVCVLVDSGIRHGADIAVAIALGADAGAIGRAYLYGLMAGGEPGVDKALALLAAQFTRTLHLLGVTSVADLRAHGQDLLTRD